jgi:hypothetical protein
MFNFFRDVARAGVTLRVCAGEFLPIIGIPMERLDARGFVSLGLFLASPELELIHVDVLVRGNCDVAFSFSTPSPVGSLQLTYPLHLTISGAG